MSGTHSILAPSSAAGWMQCAAWPRMNAPYANDPPTPESAEGDAAHWLACRVTQEVPPHNPALGVSWLGIKAPNGVTIDQDMIDGAELFAEVVGEFATHETRVTCAGIHPHCYGTPDADYGEPAHGLHIYDYKYGHRFVEVFENWQLIAYALGVIETRYGGIRPPKIVFTIVQPRAYHRDGPVRTWTIDSPAQFNDYVARLHAGAWAAVDQNGVPRPDAPATTGPECRDCRARHECTLFQAVAARLVDETGRAERYNLPPAQLGAELSYLDEALERLKARRDGLAIQAESHLSRGDRVPGYEMGEGRANEKWRDDVSVPEVIALGDVMGATLGKKPELLTPTQARAELKRRCLDPQLLDAYAFRPRGKMQLQRSETIRARKAFGVNSK